MSTIDEAREALLKRLKRDASAAPAEQVRNIATAYGILTDKRLQESHVTSFQGADGRVYYRDALGRDIDPEALGALRDDKS